MSDIVYLGKAVPLYTVIIVHSKPIKFQMMVKAFHFPKHYPTFCIPNIPNNITSQHIKLKKNPVDPRYV